MKSLAQFKSLCPSSMISLTWLMIITITLTMTISCNSNEEAKIPEEKLNVTSLPLLEPTKTLVLKPTATLTPTPEPTSVPTSTPIPTPTPTPISKSTPAPTSTPIPTPKPILNLIDVLKIMNLETNGDYSVFTDYLKNTGLENEISTRKQVTLFLPSNSTFEILKIYLNEDEIKNILEMHILPFKFKEKDIKKISHLDTLKGDGINVEITDRKPVIFSKKVLNNLKKLYWTSLKKNPKKFKKIDMTNFLNYLIRKKYEINCVKLTGRWNEYDDFIDLNYNF